MLLGVVYLTTHPQNRRQRHTSHLVPRSEALRPSYLRQVRTTYLHWIVGAPYSSLLGWSLSSPNPLHSSCSWPTSICINLHIYSKRLRKQLSHLNVSSDFPIEHPGIYSGLSTHGRPHLVQLHISKGHKLKWTCSLLHTAASCQGRRVNFLCLQFLK